MAKIDTHIWIAEVNVSALTVCVPGQANPIEIKYPEGTLSHMELADPGRLFESMNQAFQVPAGTKAQVIVIFADALCFEFDLSNLPQAQQDVHYASILDTVPFESVLAKKIKFDEKHMYAAAINRTLYDFFRSLLSAKGLEVVAVVPAIVAKNLGYDGQLNAKVCNLLYKKAKQLELYSFTSDRDQGQAFATTQRHYINKHQGFFALLSFALVVVCGVTAVVTLRRPTPVKSNTQVLVRLPTATPTLSPTPTPIPVAEISVTLVHGRTAPGLQRLLVDLKAAGYEQLNDRVATRSATATQVEFGTETPEMVRQNITALLSNIFADVATQVTDASSSAVLINLGTRLKNTP